MPLPPPVMKTTRPSNAITPPLRPASLPEGGVRLQVVELPGRPRLRVLAHDRLELRGARAVQDHAIAAEGELLADLRHAAGRAARCRRGEPLGGDQLRD